MEILHQHVPEKKQKKHCGNWGRIMFKTKTQKREDLLIWEKNFCQIYGC